MLLVITRVITIAIITSVLISTVKAPNKLLEGKHTEMEIPLKEIPESLTVIFGFDFSNRYSSLKELWIPAKKIKWSSFLCFE